MTEAGATREQALRRLRDRVESSMEPSQRPWWTQALQATATPPGLTRHLPALRRRLGAAPLSSPSDPERFLASPDFLVDLAALRRCDGAAMCLFEIHRACGGEEGLLRELFDHGDVDERVAAMRCLPLVTDPVVVPELAGEAQRSNTLDVVEAAFCDHDACTRHLSDDEFHRMVLKLAFADLPFWRVLGGRARASAALSAMLEDFATEREAAGRPIWASTLILLALAPIEGSEARILDHLDHENDEIRETAAEAVGLLDRAELAPYLRERAEGEAHPRVRAALEHALRRLGEREAST